MQSDVQKVLEAISNTFGNDFFNVITLVLHKAIKADFTYIAVINEDEYSSQTITSVANDKIVANLEYSLEHTPCANVVKNSICYYPDNVCNIYPKDHRLAEHKIQAYLGIPLCDSKQRVVGLIVALYKKPLEDNSIALTLFQEFSGRITAELIHLNHKSALENKISTRTLTLSSTVLQLKQTQQELIESEKMASLGGLVAGITHEVNTPLGIAITAHSIITDEHRLLNSKITSEHLSMNDMQHYCQTVDNALIIQGENLTRAKKLIENFKKTAVDQHQLEIETINIYDYYSKVISTLTSILKAKKASIEITGCDNINVATYPGVHAQILTNLITNSVRHAFEGVVKNKIMINIIQHKDFVEVHYQDNGIGLSDHVQQHIFEPFFTTARESGGIGLGMSIVHTLITQKLNGDIFIDKKSKGAHFIYQFTDSKP